MPTTAAEWRKIQSNFEKKWNFPNCVGALDGKHIQIRKPPHSGSQFYTYKHSYSIILFASVDANYCFRYIDVGTNGRANDASIFSNSSLNKALQKNILNLPNNAVFVGDEAFPLRCNLLKPYPKSGATPLNKKQRIFNYRLSRARRIVENAFGILASVFRIFEKAISVDVETVDLIVKSACALHNWLLCTDRHQFVSANLVDIEDIENIRLIPGAWRAERRSMDDIIGGITSNNSSREAQKTRDEYVDYFSGEGAVYWQDEMINKEF